MEVIEPESQDPDRPYANMLPILDFLLRHGNRPLDGGFILNPDGWRARLEKPIDFAGIRHAFQLPASIQLGEAHDTILDTSSWISIEGPGAH